MAIEPFEVNTFYADGRKETRMSTPEEMAQREKDLAKFQADINFRNQELAKIEAKRESARSKLRSLGLDEEEINTIIK